MIDTQPALILFAHGARDPRWAAPFEAVAARIRTARPGGVVRLAFLEFMTPGLVEAASALVAEGARSIDIVPMFLGTGGHVQRDLPKLIEALEAAHPDLRCRLHLPIGEVESVSVAMAQACIAALGSAQESAA